MKGRNEDVEESVIMNPFFSSQNSLTQLPVIQKLTISIQFLNKGYLPPFSGHLLRGLVNRLMASVDSSLVHIFHEESKRRPYCISTLKLRDYTPAKRVRKTGEFKIDKGDIAEFSIFLVGTTIQQRVIHSVLNATVKEPNVFLLPVQIISMEIIKQTWIDYPQPSGLYYIDFHTPTQFKNSEGNLYLFPDPERFFSSLGKLWMELIPDFPIDIAKIREIAKKYTYVRDHSLKTRSVYLGKITEQTGFKGRITLVTKKDDDKPSYLNWIPYLLQFGQWMNIGYYRSIGMGNFNFLKK